MTADQPAGREPARDPSEDTPTERDAAEREAPDPVREPVEAWGVQSFPASDPPSWWAGP